MRRRRRARHRRSTCIMSDRRYSPGRCVGSWPMRRHSLGICRGAVNGNRGLKAGRAGSECRHAAGSSTAAILRDARLRRALRMRDEYAATFQRRWMQLSLILRSRRTRRLEGRGARSGAAETSYATALICDSPPSFRESARNDGREEEEERSTMSKARRPRHGPPTWIGVQSM